MSWNEEAENISAADEPVLSTVSVDLCGYPNDRHSRLEWGDERQRNRKAAHAPVCQQKLLCGALSPTRQSVIQPDAHRGCQQDGKYHIVCNSEVLLVGRVHPDCLWVTAAVWESFDFGPLHSQTGGKYLCPHPSVSRVQQPWRKRSKLKTLIRSCLHERQHTFAGT